MKKKNLSSIQFNSFFLRIIIHTYDEYDDGDCIFDDNLTLNILFDKIMSNETDICYEFKPISLCLKNLHL